MRKLCVVVLLGLIALSCGLSEIGGDSNVNGGIWGGLSGGAGSFNSVCYMIAVDYAKDYDWRSDMSRENVKCSLVVYTDGSPVMKVPVGKEEQISADADMHRIIDGSLYTDYATESETIIKKNGELLFQYDGSERIADIIVRDQDVFTLGESRSGSGFSLRKNGEVVMSRDKGSLIAPLRADGDSLCFGFSEPILSTSGTIERYYAVYGQTVTNLSVREDMNKVWDLCSIDGNIVCLASLKAVAQPVIIRGNDIRAVNMESGLTVLSCSLLRLGNSFAVEGVCKTASGALKSGIWVDTNPLVMFEHLNISSVCVDGTGVCCVLNPVDNNTCGLIYRCGDIYKMPQGYSCIGSNSVAMVNGILNVGLSSQKGENPLLWKDGQIDTMSINGYVSWICAD